jgi:hypothetical protein
VIAFAFAAAVYVHQRDVTVTIPGRSPAEVDPTNCSNYVPGGLGSRYCAGLKEDPTSYTRHPSWEDPAAVLLAIGGVAVAVGIVASRRTA